MTSEYGLDRPETGGNEIPAAGETANKIAQHAADTVTQVYVNAQLDRADAATVPGPGHAEHVDDVQAGHVAVPPADPDARTIAINPLYPSLRGDNLPDVDSDAAANHIDELTYLKSRPEETRRI